jgi:hypothetical protein
MSLVSSSISSFIPPSPAGKRPDAAHSEEPRTGDDERGLKEGTDLVCASSRACSKRFSTLSSSVMTGRQNRHQVRVKMNREAAFGATVKQQQARGQTVSQVKDDQSR